MRLIDADACLEVIDDAFFKTDPNGEEQIGFLTCRRLVRETPTIDAEPVRHGYWTFFKSIAGDEYTFECSICNEWGDRRHSYCPNCGAKMDAEVE